MKNKEQILQHLKDVGYTNDSIIKICGWMIGKGLKEQNEHIKVQVGNSNFNTFIEWYNKNNEPKFKVGDWIRDEETDFVCKIKGTSEMGQLYYDVGGAFVLYKNAIPYSPKEGEFYVTKKTDGYESAIVCGNYAFCHNRAFERTNAKNPYIDRPAISKEKQTLIKTVEEKFNKTHNGKEWVDMKPQYKKGDYVIFKNGAIEIIGDVLDENRYIGIAYYHNQLTMMGGISMYDYISRLANDSEKKTINKWLESQGYKFNQETKELEEILKVGDLVIAWNFDKSKAIINVLTKIVNEDMIIPYLLNCGSWYKHVIKFKSEQQFKEFIKQ